MGLHFQPSYGEVSFGFSRVGDPELMYITWGYYSGGVDNSFIPTIGSRLALAFMDATKAAIDDSIVLEVAKNVYCNGTDGNNPDVSTEESVGIAGTDSYAIATQNTAILVKKTTSAVGRRNTGRVYLPWVSESQVSDSGVLATLYRASWQTKMGDFISRLDSAHTGMDQDFTLQILHSDGVSAVPDPTPVDNLLVESVVGTQRRRLRR